MAVDALVSGKVRTAASIEKDIDAVTLDSVNTVGGVLFSCLSDALEI